MEKFKLFISVIYKSENEIERVHEEENLKKEIAQLLHKKEYKFVIAEID